MDTAKTQNMAKLISSRGGVILGEVDTRLRFSGSLRELENSQLAATLTLANVAGWMLNSLPLAEFDGVDWDSVMESTRKQYPYSRYCWDGPDHTYPEPNLDTAFTWLDN